MVRRLVADDPGRSSPAAALPGTTGRKRDPDLTGRLLTEAVTLIAEHGIEQFNADALAARTRSGRASIYRRWPDLTELVVQALRTCTLVQPVGDHFSLRADLLALLRAWSRPLNTEERAVASVLGQAHRNPAIADCLHDVLATPLHTVLVQVAGRHARRSGGLPVPRLQMLSLVVQSLWWQRYVTPAAPASEARLQAIVDGLLLPAVLDARQPCCRWTVSD